MSSFKDLADKVHGITTVVASAEAAWAGVRQRLVDLREAPTTADIDALVAELDAATGKLSAAIANTPGTPVPLPAGTPAPASSGADPAAGAGEVQSGQDSGPAGDGLFSQETTS